MNHRHLLTLFAVLALACLPAITLAQPPALPGAAASTFHIDEGGSPSGPLTLDQLRQRVAAGTLTAATLAWTEGMPGWQPAAQVTGLSSLFQQSATPGFPTTASPPATPAADPQRFLVGRWQVKGKLPMGDQGPTDGEITMTYNPDGSFLMAGLYQVPHPQAGVIPIQTHMTGQWQVNGVDANGAIGLFLTGDMRMEAPAQYNIPVQTESMIEDDALQVVDTNTIVDGSGLTWRRL